MRELCRITAFFSFLLLISISAPSQDRMLDQIINMNEAAIGGPGALREIQNMRMTTRIEQAGQAVETDTFWIKRPNLIRREANADGMRVVTGFDGITGWALDPRKGSQPRKDESASFSSDSESIESNINWIAALKSAGAEVKLLGKEEVKGAQAYKLNVGGRIYYIDAATYLPVRIDMEFFVSTIAMYPSDYRKVHGILLPSILSMEGRQVRIEYLFNVPMNDALFKMPSAANSN